MASVLYSDLCDVLRKERVSLIDVQQNASQQILCQYILEKVPRYCPSKVNELETKISNFCRNLHRKYVLLNRKYDRLSSSEWARNVFDYSFLIAKPPGGRPKKPFSELGNKAKKIRIEPLVKSIPCEELTYASKCSLLNEGKRAEAAIIGILITFSEKAKIIYTQKLKLIVFLLSYR